MDSRFFLCIKCKKGTVSYGNRHKYLIIILNNSIMWYIEKTEATVNSRSKRNEGLQ